MKFPSIHSQQVKVGVKGQLDGENHGSKKNL